MLRKTAWLILLFPLVAGPVWGKSKIAHLYGQGLIAFSDNQLELALTQFQKAYKIDPEDRDNLYMLGLTHLGLRQYRQSAKTLERLLAKDPHYYRAYLDYGMSLYRQNQYAAALPWFERAFDQENPYPRFYAAVCHFQLQQTDQSKELFEQTIRRFPQSKMAQASREWLERLESGVTPPTAGGAAAPAERWALRGATSFFYDSNLTLDPDGQDLTNTTNQDDFGGSANLNFRYHLVDQERWRLTGELMSYQSLYTGIVFDSNGFNFGRHQGGLQTAVRLTDTAQFRFPLNYSFATLGKAKYVQSVRTLPAFDFSWKEDWLTTVTAGLRRDHFFGEPTNTVQDRDANHLSGKVEQFYFLPQNREVYFKLGYEYENNLAQGADWDFQAHHISGSASTPLWWRLHFLLLTDTIVYRRFAHADSVFSEQRRDFFPTVVVSLSREIIPHLTAALSYTFAYSNSNISRFDYKRHVGGLTVAAHF